MSKPKGVKTMRTPPASTDLDNWVKGESTDAPKRQAPDNPKTQATEQPRPDGPGIVKRADGTYRRRLAVYLKPEHADQLKMRAVIAHRDMSDIVDELVREWLSSNPSG